MTLFNIGFYAFRVGFVVLGTLWILHSLKMFIETAKKLGCSKNPLIIELENMICFLAEAVIVRLEIQEVRTCLQAIESKKH